MQRDFEPLAQQTESKATQYATVPVNSTVTVELTALKHWHTHWKTAPDSLPGKNSPDRIALVWTEDALFTLEGGSHTHVQRSLEHYMARYWFVWT